MWTGIAWVECGRCSTSMPTPQGAVPVACEVCGARFDQGAPYCAIRAPREPPPPHRDARDLGERECAHAFCRPGERKCGPAAPRARRAPADAEREPGPRDPGGR